MSSISNTQVEDLQIRRLAAQRQTYTDAKRYLHLQVALTALGGLAGLLVALYYPEHKAWAALYGVVYSALDYFVLTNRQNDLKKQAAKIQELFDGDVLGLEWSSLVAGDKPDDEYVSKQARQHLAAPEHRTTLVDWYPTRAGEVPVHIGRVICQRANLVWDQTLRRDFARWITNVSWALVVGVVILLYSSKVDFDVAVIAVVVPLSPLFYLAVKHRKDNLDAADRLDRLKRAVDKLWEKTLSNPTSIEPLTVEARRIQDEIFDHRSKTPLLLDFIHRLFRGNQQIDMEAAANEMVIQARQVLQ